MTYRICVAVLVACLGTAIALAEDKDKKEKDTPTTQPVNKMCAVDQEHKADIPCVVRLKDNCRRAFRRAWRRPEILRVHLGRLRLDRRP